jgi:hypothetical protein
MVGGAVSSGSWFATATSIAMGGASILPVAIIGGAVIGTTVGPVFAVRAIQKKLNPKIPPSNDAPDDRGDGGDDDEDEYEDKDVGGYANASQSKRPPRSTSSAPTTPFEEDDRAVLNVKKSLSLPD